MANRVYITKDYLKLSKPGQNAMTAGNGNLLFSSDFLALDRVDYGQLTVTNTWQSAPYPYTLPRLPLVTAIVQQGASIWWHVNKGNQHSGTETLVQMLVETGQVYFRLIQPSIASLQVRYTVWSQ